MKQQDNICTKSSLVFVLQLSSLSLSYYDRTADTQRTEKIEFEISFSTQEGLLYFSFHVKEFYRTVSSYTNLQAIKPVVRFSLSYKIQVSTCGQ